jgi:hypothetical protein
VVQVENVEVLVAAAVAAAAPGLVGVVAEGMVVIVVVG